MEQHSQRNDASVVPATTLEGQLREMYARAAYTHKTHEKMADRYIARYKLIKTAEIILSAMTTSSLLLAVLGDSHPYTIVGALLSTVLLGFALYFKEASLGEQAQKHTIVASKLWGVRETLLSLLVDMKDGRAVDEIRNVRDRLNESLEDIYKAAPRTNSKAYGDAQRALKQSEELFFTDDELDRMLPKELRTKRP
ncbi:SLATT domain-containing protein [Burkholderia sp. BCCIQ04A]|uniref:SLATT domain-containing protein n=1 Tax=Burkholderia anthinoferrum TaxID=3090833 RepID=A0ABU5WLD2_9BURK|nr:MULTISPECIES: SLATT domain-containing protein [Burkholderia]MEB2503848.1 SLATT domain-containing protein [Burkholderia anthinoferrum]MEB2533270.1 SLATT domain-containing protein [Burkholderia anthinoferrum]MEB2561508.1 SLATT domain-containing protein [Burkholderia anthinoferrum]MEB2579540.1 SLATT domain-containing protein [Burkholderia anthinoferrum]MDF3099074.1 SLATT domain-containing protein [Burkholderia semiarida]